MAQQGDLGVLKYIANVAKSDTSNWFQKILRKKKWKNLDGKFIHKERQHHFFFMLGHNLMLRKMHCHGTDDIHWLFLYVGHQGYNMS